MIYSFDCFCWYDSTLPFTALSKDVATGDNDVIALACGNTLAISGFGVRDDIKSAVIRGKQLLDCIRYS